MHICVVGTGYVGLVCAACFAEMGNTVTCIDVNSAIVQNLQQGKVHIFEPGLEALVVRNHAKQRLVFSTNLEEGLATAEIVFICVGTPSQEDGSCDLSYMTKVARSIGQQMKHPLILVDKSTVPVGTADTVRSLVAEELKKRQVCLDFDVVSNPEFLKEGDAVNDFMRPDRVIIGTENPHSVEVLRTLYAPFARTREKLMLMSSRSAEMTKYTANCMLATKISFINEIAHICELLGADIKDVRQGIGADHRIGPHFLYPGLGYGGSCFPKDVKALINTAEQVGYAAELLRTVDAVNNRQKLVMAKRIEEYFSPQGGVKGKTLALWGLSFKANTDDVRESAAIETIRYLTKRGMKIQAYDPEAGARTQEIVKGNSRVQILTEQYAVLHGADALMVATEWNQFRAPDFLRMKSMLHAPLLFDGRNLYSPRKMAELGFAYFCIGRAFGIKN